MSEQWEIVRRNKILKLFRHDKFKVANLQKLKSEYEELAVALTEGNVNQQEYFRQVQEGLV